MNELSNPIKDVTLYILGVIMEILRIAWSLIDGLLLFFLGVARGIFGYFMASIYESVGTRIAFVTLFTIGTFTGMTFFDATCLAIILTAIFHFTVT